MNKKQCLLDFQNVSSFKDSDLSNKIELEVGIFIILYEFFYRIGFIGIALAKFQII